MSDLRWRSQILESLPPRPDDDETFEWTDLSDLLVDIAKAGGSIDGSQVNEIAQELGRVIEEGLVEKEADETVFGTRFRLTWDGESIRDGDADRANGIFDPALFDQALFDTGPAVDSTSWTGLPVQGVLTEEAIGRLKIALRTTEDAIREAGGTNEELAQARAYVLAIHALADAPSPPGDLIYNLIAAAGGLAGVGSLFVALIALYR